MVSSDPSADASATTSESPTSPQMEATAIDPEAAGRGVISAHSARAPGTP